MDEYDDVHSSPVAPVVHNVHPVVHRTIGMTRTTLFPAAAGYYTTRETIGIPSDAAVGDSFYSLSSFLYYSSLLHHQEHKKWARGGIRCVLDLQELSRGCIQEVQLTIQYLDPWRLAQQLIQAIGTSVESLQHVVTLVRKARPTF